MKSKPKVGSKILCLDAPSWPAEMTAAMIGQIGTVLPDLDPNRELPDDTGTRTYDPAVWLQIQYPVSPYKGNALWQKLDQEGITWERVE